ncbi:MAG: hypothetical protein NT061_07630 [Spirochaetes bacterium]|nr:hypothetical protein [Spirochaetota bacterium]
MTASLDLVSICESQLKSLGFELLNLGRDMESEEHLYYIFDATSGAQVSERLFQLEDVQLFIDQVK